MHRRSPLAPSRRALLQLAGLTGASSVAEALGLRKSIVRAPPPPEELAALAALERHVVRAEGWSRRRELYTWTSDEQALALRTRPVLLTRTESPTHGASFYDRWMTALGTARDPLARLLTEPRFRRARFAWSNPWATVRGWPGERYGHQLVRVRLRPEALVLAHYTHGHRWELRSADGAVLPVAQATAAPARLAAVYFVHGARHLAPWGTNYLAGGSQYREFVLVNEAMLERWEVSTPALRAELTEASVMLRRLLAMLARVPSWEGPSDWADLLAWAEAPARFEPWVRAWVGSLAFFNDLYSPTRANLTALAEELESLRWRDDGQTHAVSPRALPPPPRVAPAPWRWTAPRNTH